MIIFVHINIIPIEPIAIDAIFNNESKLAAKYKNNNCVVDPEIYFHVILSSVFHRFMYNLLKNLNPMFGARFMSLLLIDSDYGDKIATTMANIQQLVDEELYNFTLKMFGTTQYSLELYDCLKYFANRGGSLLIPSQPATKTAKLRKLILQWSDIVRTSFVCCIISIQMHIFVLHYHKMLGNGTSKIIDIS
eukprot:945071_1